MQPRLDRPKNAAYVSPVFQELNNRVPKIKAKKQWNTRKLLPGLTGDEMLGSIQERS